MNKLKNISFLAITLVLLVTFTGSDAFAQEKDLNWTSFEEAVELAKEQGKPILVDVWAPWCGWCKKMQKDVYPKLAVTLNENFILTRLNRDDNESRKQYQQFSITPLRLAQKFNVQNVPAVVLLSPEGEYLFHVSGFMEADKLEEVLGYVVEGQTENLLR
ncbi:thioredoxin family protein [Gracilimonas sp.]|uniref:thioredoxin family protein n=1 Tax=Gracilimonas sp. TaxID=1974203 RepID=UPI0032ED3026